MSGFVMRDLIATASNPHSGGTDTTTIPTRLHYTLTDPYATHLTLYPPHTPPVEWLTSRNLLMEGFAATHQRHAGEGDICTWVWSERYWILLNNSTEPPLLLAMPTEDMRGFLTATIATCVPGTESSHLDVDALIRRLLEEVTPDA